MSDSIIGMSICGIIEEDNINEGDFFGLNFSFFVTTLLIRDETLQMLRKTNFTVK